MTEHRKVPQTARTFTAIDNDNECPVVFLSDGLLTEVPNNKVKKKGKKDDGRKTKSRPHSPDLNKMPMSEFMDDPIYNGPSSSSKYQPIHDRLFT